MCNRIDCEFFIFCVCVISDCWGLIVIIGGICFWNIYFCGWFFRVSGNGNGVWISDGWRMNV